MMFKRFFLVIPLFLLLAGHAAAQDISQVYITTQDYTALRAGPGRHWEKLAVLPFNATYRATGRTVDGDWLQIAYEGDLLPGASASYTVGGVTYGWVAYWLLVWSGDILQLPIDGIKTVPTAREAGPTMILYPSEYMYEGEVDPSTRVANPMDSAVTVEVTGRIGSTDAGAFLLQFKLNNRYYWTGTWAVGVPAGYRELPDGGYLFPYSRLLIELRSEANRAREALSDIGRRWRALDAGQPTTCNNIPDDFRLREGSLSPTDLHLEPIYAPTAEALTSARDSINAALARFRQVCDQPGDRLVSPDEIRAAVSDVQAAERNLAIVQTLLAPLQRTDPLFAGNQQNTTQDGGSP